MTDRQLLQCFTAEADEAAFAELVRRHGPMVLGVCRRLLGVEADADDAFQAVFLILVLRARSIRNADSVGSWLYGVASRVARRARADAHRRQAAHRRLPVRAEGVVEVPAGEEMRPVLDEELDRLPDKYRAPLVLCYLQGKTHEQAADELGWPTGSMSRRLARARDLLRRRLVRRGVTLSFGAALTCAVPEALARAAVRAGLSAAGTAGGTVPAAAAALAKGVIHTMFLTKCKTVAIAVLSLLLLGVGGGMLVHRTTAAPRSQGVKAPTPQATAGQEGVSTPRGEARQAVRDKGGAPKGKVGGPGSKREILALAFSPDGKTVVVGFNDRIEDWNTGTWKMASQFGHGAVALAYSPDGQRLADAPVQGNDAHLYDRNTGGAVVVRGHAAVVTAVAFSPDGKVLVTGSKDKSIRLWDVATAREIRRLDGRQGEILAVAISRDGRVLASGGADNSVCLWDVQTGQIIARCLGAENPNPNEAVTAVAFSPDGSLLAVGSLDKRVCLVESHTGKLLRVLKRHTEGILGVAFAPDGQQLASVGKDNRVVLWDLVTGKRPAGEDQPTTLPGENVRVHAVAFSPDGRFIVFGSGAALRVWDRQQKAYVKTGGQ